MADQILTILLVILVLSLVWGLLKAVLKLTLKVFSCGLFFILAIGVLILLTTNIEIF
ncbi:MAG: hypothetical protein ISS57_04330 [Anaerolineales bacterium]|nr:hypothetical protein [Anaerolineales bacterium]